MKECILSEMTGKKVDQVASEIDKAIVVFGATENHGPHLPYGTDFMAPYELALRILQKVKGAIVIPAMPYGMSMHHSDFLFTISLRPETLTEVAKDIFNGLVKHKIKKIIVINGHDGNIAPIEIAARHVKEETGANIVVLEAWWSTAGRLLPEGTFEVYDGLGHAGEAETSLMLALFPELVDEDESKKLRAMLPNLPDDPRIFWRFSELSKVGYTGDPSTGTLEKGLKTVSVLVDCLAEFINDMDQKNWKYGLK